MKVAHNTGGYLRLLLASTTEDLLEGATRVSETAAELGARQSALAHLADPKTCTRGGDTCYDAWNTSRVNPQPSA